MSWIIDHIPIWVYIVLGLLGSGALFYFFSPILIPLWNLTPKWIKALGAAILSVLGAYLAGRYRGSKDERDREERANAEAIQNRQKIDQDVAKAPDSDID